MRSIRLFFRRLLTERKIVVISHNRVSNVPLSSKLQVLSGVALAGFIGWMAYATLVYFNYTIVLIDKESQIAAEKDRNVVLSEHYAMLQRDLLRLAENPEDKKKTQYENYFLEQYAAQDVIHDETTLVDRITYLEDRLLMLENYRQDFLDSLGERTYADIEELKKIISMTGVEVPDFKAYRNIQKQNKEAKSTPEDGESVNQGGPFIGYSDELGQYNEPEVVDGLIELAVLNDILNAMPLANPTKGARITSHYGRRLDPFTKKRAMHYGLDFAGPVGTKIVATAPGKVVHAGRKGAYGRLVEIDHGHGFKTRYGHLSKIYVKKGEQVTLGQEIGVQGNSGRSTGAHLHYEVRFNNKPLNPYKFVKAGKHVPEKVRPES